MSTKWVLGLYGFSLQGPKLWLKWDADHQYILTQISLFAHSHTWHTTAVASGPSYDSSSTCQRHTCSPLLSRMSFQWANSSSPLLFRPAEKENYVFNSLAPGRFECDSKSVIFNPVLLIGIFRVSHDNALQWMPQDLTDDKSTLVQVMAWCHQTTCHYLSQCWLSSLSPYGIARPQWINSSVAGRYGRNSKSIIFKVTLLNSSLKSPLRECHKTTNVRLTLIQVMAWCRQGTSHNLSQCGPRFMSPYGIARPQWVNCFEKHKYVFPFYSCLPDSTKPLH